MRAGIVCATTECYLRYVELTDMYNSALPTSRRLTDSIIASKLEDAAKALGPEVRNEVRANIIAHSADGDRAKVGEQIQLAIGLVESEGTGIDGKSLIGRKREKERPPWETRAFDAKKDRPCSTCQGAHWRKNCTQPQPERPVKGGAKVARGGTGPEEHDDHMDSCDEDEFVGTFMEQLRDVVPQELTGGADGSAAAMEAGSSAVSGRALVGRANVPIASDAASEASDDPYDDTTIVVRESDSFVAPDPELVIRAYGITVGPEQGIKCGTWDAPDNIKDHVVGVSARPGVPVTMRIKSLEAAIRLSRVHGFRAVNGGPRAFLGVAAGDPIPGATAEDIARVPPAATPRAADPAHSIAPPPADAAVIYEEIVVSTDLVAAIFSLQTCNTAGDIPIQFNSIT